MEFSWVDVLGYAAAAAVFATYSMKTMIPLRLVGIGSNCLFIAYGALSGAVPVLVLHLVLLPLNAWRLHQMLSLIRKVRQAASADLSLDWLKPFMSSRHDAPGEIVFRAGDSADCMYYVVDGSFSLVEPDLQLTPGALVGEMGLVAPRNLRSFTLRCDAGGGMLVMDYERVRELYFQNPQFGFYLLRLMAERMVRNMTAPDQKAGDAIRSSFAGLTEAPPADPRFGRPRQTQPQSLDSGQPR